MLSYDDTVSALGDLSGTEVTVRFGSPPVFPTVIMSGLLDFAADSVRAPGHESWVGRLADAEHRAHGRFTLARDTFRTAVWQLLPGREHRALQIELDGGTVLAVTFPADETP